MWTAPIARISAAAPRRTPATRARAADTSARHTPSLAPARVIEGPVYALRGSLSIDARATFQLIPRRDGAILLRSSPHPRGGSAAGRAEARPQPLRVTRGRG